MKHTNQKTNKNISEDSNRLIPQEHLSNELADQAPYFPNFSELITNINEPIKQLLYDTLIAPQLELQKQFMILQEPTNRLKQLIGRNIIFPINYSSKTDNQTLRFKSSEPSEISRGMFTTNIEESIQIGSNQIILSKIRSIELNLERKINSLVERKVAKALVDNGEVNSQSKIYTIKDYRVDSFGCRVSFQGKVSRRHSNNLRIQFLELVLKNVDFFKDEKDVEDFYEKFSAKAHLVSGKNPMIQEKGIIQVFRGINSLYTKMDPSIPDLLIISGNRFKLNPELLKLI